MSGLSGCRVVRVSGFYETEPVGYEQQGRFLNAAAEVKTSLEPLDLLDGLLAIERTMGRVREIKWGPRNIDLDILFYGDRVLNHPRLTLPHPLMHRRGFVLVPLADIAPRSRHPLLGSSVKELLRLLPSAAEGIRPL